jgi:hypothetical protein
MNCIATSLPDYCTWWAHPGALYVALSSHCEPLFYMLSILAQLKWFRRFATKWRIHKPQRHVQLWWFLALWRRLEHTPTLRIPLLHCLPASVRYHISLQAILSPPLYSRMFDQSSPALSPIHLPTHYLSWLLSLLGVVLQKSYMSLIHLVRTPCRFIADTHTPSMPSIVHIKWTAWLTYIRCMSPLLLRSWQIYGHPLYYDSSSIYIDRQFAATFLLD